MELPVVAGISALIAGFCLPIWLPLALLFFIPVVIYSIYSAVIAVRNSKVRYRWSKQFSRQITIRQLRALAKEAPDRYFLHLQYYGGFDRVRLKPAAVLEDIINKELIAIHPPSWKTPTIGEKYGIKIITG